MEISHEGRSKVQKNNDYESYLVSQPQFIKLTGPYQSIQLNLHRLWVLDEHRIPVLEE